jgi:serine protease AprX
MIVPVQAPVRRSLTALIAVALVAAVVGARPAAAIVAVDPALEAGGGAIVRVADGSERRVAAVARAAGAEDVRILETLDLVTARLSDNAVRTLAVRSDIRGITADTQIEVAGGGWRNLDGSGNWVSVGIKATEAEGAHKQSLGSGVTVALLDTGVAPNAAFGGRLLGQVDLVNDGAALPDPAGHGTHLAGMIIGDQPTVGFKGMAPAAQLVSVRVLNANGVGTVSAALAGFDWVLKNRKAYNIRVVNLSFGAPQRLSYHEDHLAAGVEAMWFSGVFVVAASGNDSLGRVLTPGADPFVMTVGSLDDMGSEGYTDDVPSEFMSRGPTLDGLVKPDVLAPGRRVLSVRAEGSTLDTTYPDRRTTLSTASGSAVFYRMSGTSVATAIASGAAALHFAKNPTSTPTQAKMSLATTGGDVAGWNRIAARAGLRQGGAPVNQGLFPSRKLLQLVNGSPTATNLTWENVTWENISWENVTWENLTWESITWENVTWENLSWELAVNP